MEELLLPMQRCAGAQVGFPFRLDSWSRVRLPGCRFRKLPVGRRGCPGAWARSARWAPGWGRRGARASAAAAGGGRACRQGWRRARSTCRGTTRPLSWRSARTSGPGWSPSRPTAPTAPTPGATAGTAGAGTRWRRRCRRRSRSRTAPCHLHAETKLRLLLPTK